MTPSPSPSAREEKAAPGSDAVPDKSANAGRAASKSRADPPAPPAEEPCESYYPGLGYAFWAAEGLACRTHGRDVNQCLAAKDSALASARAEIAELKATIEKVEAHEWATLCVRCLDSLRRAGGVRRAGGEMSVNLPAPPAEEWCHFEWQEAEGGSLDRLYDHLNHACGKQSGHRDDHDCAVDMIAREDAALASARAEIAELKGERDALQARESEPDAKWLELREAASNLRWSYLNGNYYSTTWPRFLRSVAALDGRALSGEK
jgi:hypothetical protein